MKIVFVLLITVIGVSAQAFDRLQLVEVLEAEAVKSTLSNNDIKSLVLSTTPDSFGNIQNSVSINSIAIKRENGRTRELALCTTVVTQVVRSENSVELPVAPPSVKHHQCVGQ